MPSTADALLRKTRRGEALSCQNLLLSVAMREVWPANGEKGIKFLLKIECLGGIGARRQGLGAVGFAAGRVHSAFAFAVDTLNVQFNCGGKWPAMRSSDSGNKEIAWRRKRFSG